MALGKKYDIDVKVEEIELRVIKKTLLLNARTGKKGPKQPRSQALSLGTRLGPATGPVILPNQVITV